MSQIKLLLDIISDVRSLGDSLQAYADALTTSEKIGDLNDYEEIYTPPEMQPEPVHISRISGFSTSSRHFSPSSTSVSVSCLGISTFSFT